jgi:tRNA (Thr-GGU) A37 N-methylase
MDTEERGIFACRAPMRPNAIGISTVRLIRIHENIIDIEQVDMLDGTPLVDIKPFYSRYDTRDDVKIGWLEKNKICPLKSCVLMSGLSSI